MFWIVIVIVAGLAGFAFGWITVQKTRERLIFSFELTKVAPAIEKLKQAAARMAERGRDVFVNSRRS